MDNRNHMGKNKEGVIFPVVPNLSEMGDNYLQFIEEIKNEIRKQRISVVLNANSSMICLYWSIGKAILEKQEKEGWGAKVIDRLAKDLKEAFPDMSGFSPRNIKYMRKFAECWSDFEIVQQVVAQIPFKLGCYVVIELKACDFEPGFISQLNMYQNAVNDILRHPDDKPTIIVPVAEWFYELQIILMIFRIQKWIELNLNI